MVAVWVGKGEGATEWAVHRSRDNRVAFDGKSVVNGLDVGGVEPDRCTDAGLCDGGKISAGHDVPQREGDRCGLKHDGMWGTGLGADEAEVLLVERLGSVEVARLE